MRGKWSKGIEPRNFGWVIKDQLAVCERPGGYSANHRRVRRHEEVMWIRESGFARVISLMPSPHNLHAYEELHVPYEHVPFGPHDDVHNILSTLYPKMRSWMQAGDHLLVHQDEISDRLQGFLGGYLLYAKLLPGSPQAVMVIEHLLSRQLGSIGREIVAMAARGI